MAFLKVLIALLLLFCSSLAHASSPLQAAQVSVLGSAGVGDLYGAGGSAELQWGKPSEQMGPHRSGNFHFNYLAQLSPSDPNDDTSPSKHEDNWSGGVLIDLSPEASIGVDLDHLSDSFESLYADGIKFGGSYGFLDLSYRFAKSLINSPFQLTPTSAQLQGAFVYQSSYEVGADFLIGYHDAILTSLVYSAFTPSISAFADLLNRPVFASLANFQDTLQNFELWSASIIYDHRFRHRWEASLNARFAHVIVGTNPLIELTPAVQYGVTKNVALQLSWDYAFTPDTVESIYSLALRYSWQKPRDQ